ncbi:MAG TPA: AAA family ATPase [Pseudacidobacterium sp.]|jgi:predicted ATPase|nr:AAA family ATPase [Pseudacidobacterium sp.]
MLLYNKTLSNDRLFVLTGGPGVGKTAILNELQRRGFACVREAARQIIQEQVKTGADAVPWLNLERYSSLMLDQSVADYIEHEAAGKTTFFDRGIPDTVAHYRLANLALPDKAYQQAQQHEYNRTVFLAPPWKEIYETDSERKQTFDDSLVVYRVIREVYAGLGYDLVEIPHAPVNTRVEFILGHIE